MNNAAVHNSDDEFKAIDSFICPTFVATKVTYVHTP